MAVFEMPDFHAPFLVECNPHLAMASRAMWEWIDTHDLATTEKARDRMRRTGADLSGAYVWPRAGLDMLTNGLRWLALTFRIDDQIDEDDVAERLEARVAAVDELCGVLHGLTASGRSPVARALATLWQETSQGRPVDWQNAFVRNFEAFLRSYATEAALSAQGHVPRLDDYLRWRMYSVGMPWLWDLDELRLPVFLPNSVRTCAPMVNLRRAGSLHVALVNDVFSVHRETIVGYQYNAVTIIRDAQQCSLQEAVDQVAALVTSQVHTVVEAGRELREDLDRQAVPPIARTATLDYAANITANLSGQLVWHSSVERYAVDDIQPTGRSGNYPDDLLPGE
ncbi:terpene synthase family protein [Streptomyces sp. DSM 40750]|uniref:terpene synthase family protein n=1 Tax=Streptomyces sp. DSM 40750 TaxID=2801030 RepID=UPI00214C925D|nr:terpene synthase family protein [Streptomyces sp. DSM 40750]UUU20227.1 terpene synthase family protein [Streptomyces sp. DSM 40750]